MLLTASLLEVSVSIFEGWILWLSYFQSFPVTQYLPVILLLPSPCLCLFHVHLPWLHGGDSLEVLTSFLMFQHFLHLQLKLNSFLIFLSWYLTEVKYTNIPKQWLMYNKHLPRCWGQEEKGTTEGEMAGWHHWLDGRESQWTPGVGDGQGGLACCDSWGHRESDMTEWLIWSDLIWRCSYFFLIINPFVFLSFSRSANSSIFILCLCSLNKVLLSPVTQLFIWLWMFPPCLPSRPDIINDKLFYKEDFHLLDEKVKAYDFKLLFQKFTLYTPIINYFRIAVLLELCTLFSTDNYCKNWS